MWASEHTALWTKRETYHGEVLMLYHDYIKYLWEEQFTRDYITNWGFESLTMLAGVLAEDAGWVERTDA